MFEIPYVYGSVFVPVNGIQIVAGNGVRFQWIVHQVGKRFGQENPLALQVLNSPVPQKEKR